MASKGPEAFRTISEVAEELDLPQHVLRFWETRFTQIRPMKRGGGRRYYRPDDVDLLRGIRILLYGEGYTIRGVQRILKEQGPRFVVAAGRGNLAGLASGPGADDADEIELVRAPARPAPRQVRPPLAADDDDGDDEVDTVAAATADDDDDDASGEDFTADASIPADASDEPAFDPREFRPLAAPSVRPAAMPRPPAVSAGRSSDRSSGSSLAADDVRRLHATLTQLLDLKRMLDQARG